MPNKTKRNSEKLFLHDLRALHSDSFYRPEEKLKMKQERLIKERQGEIGRDGDGERTEKNSAEEGSDKFDMTRELHRQVRR